MSKILLIVAAVLLLGSSALSFVNKGKLTASLEDAKGAHADALAAHQDATKTHTALTKSQNDLKDTNTQLTDTKGQLASTQSQVTDLNTKLDTATKAVADKDAQIAAANQKLQDALGKVGPGGDATDIAKQIDDLKRQLEEDKVVKEGLDNQLKTATAQVQQLTKRNLDRERGVLVAGLQGRVLAVDHNWNFVVINLGDQKGVNANSTMIIQRGGSLVGKAKITSVDPTQSIADIIPNSVPAGVTVEAGDTVVFPGT